MITMVEVLTSRGDNLMLPLRDPSAGFEVRDIEGLDPVKATIVSSNFALIDGTQRQASRREARTVIMTLGLLADYVSTTPKSLRSVLYGFLMPKSLVTLRFYQDDTDPVDIVGEVESLETSLFSEDPEIRATILCFDPAFESATGTDVHGETSPASAPVAQTVMYDGSIETGVLLTIHPNRVISEFSFSIYTQFGAMEAMYFDASTGFEIGPGDVVRVVTRPGKKGVYVNEQGFESSVLFAVDPNSDWPRLYPGENIVNVNISGAPVPYSMNYYTKFGGL